MTPLRYVVKSSQTGSDTGNTFCVQPLILTKEEHFPLRPTYNKKNTYTSGRLVAEKLYGRDCVIASCLVSSTVIRQQ